MSPELTEMEARQRLSGVLSELGIGHGATVYLGIDLSRVPLPAWTAAIDRHAMQSRRRKWCEFVFSALMDAVGEDGTLVTPAFTYSFAGHGTPYIHETSPAEVGPFPEFVRCLPGAKRSFHPMFSLVAIGRRAGEITDNVGRSAFGAMSAFGRLSRLDTRFLFLGLTVKDALTYCHHLEQTYGVTHRYIKVIDTPVYRDGALVNGPWLSYLRYTGSEAAVDLSAFEVRLAKSGTLREVRVGSFVNQCIGISDVDRIGYDMLMERPSSFASLPVLVELDESEVSLAPTSQSRVRFHLRNPSASRDKRT